MMMGPSVLGDILGFKVKFIAFWFLRRKFVKLFTIYDCGGHLVQLTKISNVNVSFPLRSMFHMQFDLEWPICLRKEGAIFGKKGYIPIYSQEQTTPWVQTFI